MITVSKSKIHVKMYQLKIKTFEKLSEFEQLLFESSKIHSNSSSTSTNQILKKTNYSNSKYFESSKTIIYISTKGIFNLNCTKATLKAFKNFDDSIEKIDFVSKK